MGQQTGIEWTDHTFNPWIGCQEVSPACDNCYARVQNNRRKWVNGWGPDGERRLTKRWRDPIKFDREAKADGVRRRLFCASLSDVFDNAVPTQWRADLWKLIASTPNLDWQLLTKRPQNIAKMLPENWGGGWPNVWLGTSAENQEEYDRRRMHLLRIPAVVHFFSVEPMLSPVIRDLANERGKNVWYICGGESAKGIHRPMDLAWARKLRDSCRETSTPFFMKQIDKVQPIPPDLMVRQFPQSRAA